MNRDTGINDFGLLIAYLVPGATVLLGLSPFSATLQGWLATVSADLPTVGGFLYLTVSSLAVGLVVSAVRWATIDSIHARTGVQAPSLDFARLSQNVEAFGMLIEIHYKHYLFYSNMCVAIAVAYVCYRLHLGSVLSLGWPDLAFVGFEAVFFAASRDTIKKYHARCRQLLAARPPRRSGRAA